MTPGVKPGEAAPEGLDEEDVQQDFLKEYGLDKLPAWMKNLNNWYFHEFAIALDIKNMGMVDHWGTKVRIATYNAYNDGEKLIETDVKVKKRSTFLKAGKKTLVYSFITNCIINIRSGANSTY